MRKAWILAYAAYFLAMNWPVLWWANDVEARIGPFPFVIFWMLIWSLAIAIFHVAVAFRVWTDPQLPETGEEDQPA